MVYGRFSEELRDAQLLAQQINPAIGAQTYESVFEWACRFRLRDGAMFVQPDIQYVVNPGAAGQYDNALVVGAQAGINF